MRAQYATSAVGQTGISAAARGKRPPLEAEDAVNRGRAAASSGGKAAGGLGGKAAGGLGGKAAGGLGGKAAGGLGGKAAGDLGRSSGAGGGAGKGGSRSKADPVKEMHLKPRITEHDLSYKLRHMEGWLADGIRAKLVVEFRAADPSQSEAAAALADSVLARLAGKGQPLGPRQQRGDAWHVTLRPLTPKQPKQPQQKEAEKQQPQQKEAENQQQGRGQLEEPQPRRPEELPPQRKGSDAAARGAASPAA